MGRDAIGSPERMPVAIAGDLVSVVDLDEDRYRAASFLDARLIASGSPSETWSWERLRDAAPPARRPVHFILHIGHCGSTLLSRLLGEHPDLFSLREPALLRDLAEGELPPDGLEVMLGLCGRVWRPNQTALVKATSFVSEIGQALMAGGGGRALLLGVTPPVYFRGILAGPNSRVEAARLGPQRAARLERRLGRQVTARTEGEAIALAWLCETASLQAVADAFPDRCLRLDFDRVLAAPAGWLSSAFHHLGADPKRIDLQGLVGGPIMARYAKGPEHAYDAGLRAALLADAGLRESREFRAGMDWLQGEVQADPQVARIVTACAEATRAPLVGSRSAS